MPPLSPYKTLGVRKDASMDAITAAYRDRAKRFHPDKCPGDAAAAERFKEVQEAFEVLRDPEKRAHFDKTGRMPPKIDRTMRERAIGELARVMQALLGEHLERGDDLERHDLVGEMRKVLDGRRKDIQGNRDKLQGARDKLLAIAPRFKHAGKSDTTLRGLALGPVGDLDAKIENHDQQLAILVHAAELLEGREFDHEPLSKQQGPNWEVWDGGPTTKGPFGPSGTYYGFPGGKQG